MFAFSVSFFFTFFFSSYFFFFNILVSPSLRFVCHSPSDCLFLFCCYNYWSRCFKRGGSVEVRFTNKLVDNNVGETKQRKEKKTTKCFVKYLKG